MKSKEPAQTHKITFTKSGEHTRGQYAYGKTDLFNCLREMMKDGFTDFTISTIPKQNKIKFRNK